MLREITESEFDASDPLFRIIEHDYSWSFAALTLPKASHNLYLSWRSTSIQPEIKVIEKAERVWIGIDQRVVCLTFEGRVLFSLPLSSFFLQFKIFGKLLIILSQIEVLIINPDCSISSIASGKGIALDVVERDGKLVLTYLDGEEEAIYSLRS